MSRVSKGAQRRAEKRAPFEAARAQRQGVTEVAFTGEVTTQEDSPTDAYAAPAAPSRHRRHLTMATAAMAIGLLSGGRKR
jgi:hypothetical protein